MFSTTNSSSGFPHLINLQTCWNSTGEVLSVVSFTVINGSVLLPLCVAILCLAHPQRRRSKPPSHSDVFSFNMVVVEMSNVSGSILCCCGVYAHVPAMQIVGIHLITATLIGQSIFHILTCLERYVAIVHPVTYLALRKAKAVRIRNISIGCAWTLSLAGMMSASFPNENMNFIIYLCLVPITLIFIFFCCVSVLCVLIRPGPGDGRRAGRSKMRAFYTITAILAAMLVRFGGSILARAFLNSTLLMRGSLCILWSVNSWFCLPSSLVLPLLFVHKARK